MFRMRRAAEPPRADDAAEIPADEGDRRALDGDVGASPHGDADRCGGERRRVVDAVPRHGHHAAFALEALDHVALVWSGCTSAITSSMPTASRDGLRRRADIARQHDDAQALGMQLPNRLGRRGLDWIRDDHRTGEAAVDGHEDRGAPVGPEAVRRAFELGRARCRCARSSFALPTRTGVPLDAAGHAEPGQAPESPTPPSA